MPSIAQTLLDVQRAKSEKGDKFGAAVVDLIRVYGDALNLLDWETIGTVETMARRSNSIAELAFREGRGADFSGIDGPGYDQVTDSVWHLGGKVKIDKIDLKDKKAPDILMDKTRFAIRGLVHKFNDQFINGDHATEPHGFEGLNVRLLNGFGNTVYGNSSSAELDVRASAAPSEATLYTFLDKIDEAIEECDGGTPDVAFTSGDFIATLRSVLRRLGKYTAQPEQEPGKYNELPGRRSFAQKQNRPALIYPTDKGVKWYDLGFKRDQTTRVIANETVNSVGCRPVYFAKLGRDYLSGIQMYPVETTGPDRLDDMLTWQVMVDWPLGIRTVHNRTLAKLAGVRVA